eukprot:12834718-Heterocapsa_arctica.AAC.1
MDCPARLSLSSRTTLLSSSTSSWTAIIISVTFSSSVLRHARVGAQDSATSAPSSSLRERLPGYSLTTSLLPGSSSVP